MAKIDFHDYLLRPRLSDEARNNSMIAWCELEQQYGIKFFLRDETFRPVNEWLDDLYLKFTPAQAIFIVEQIMMNGEILFADILKHKE